MYLSVVLPSYNEMRNIQSGVLEQVYSFLKTRPYSWELILSDDGSNDGTQKQLDLFAAKHAKVRVLRNTHKGKGPTVMSGLTQAKGENVLFSDFDQATPIIEVDELLAFAQKGYDVVIGSREGHGATREKEPLHRHIMGRVFNICVQLLAVRGIRDTQCGFKLFTHAAIQNLSTKLVIYNGDHNQRGAFTGAFDVELLFIASKEHLKIAEVPVQWRHVKTDRVDPLKDSLHMFIDLVYIRLADMTGKYRV